MRSESLRYVIACTARGVTVQRRGNPPNPSGAAFMTRKRFENDKLPRMRLCVCQLGAKGMLAAGKCENGRLTWSTRLLTTQTMSGMPSTPSSTSPEPANAARAAERKTCVSTRFLGADGLSW